MQSCAVHNVTHPDAHHLPAWAAAAIRDACYWLTKLGIPREGPEGVEAIISDVVGEWYESRHEFDRRGSE